MGYAVYRLENRFAGYGVPAICEHPDCNKEIDRGMAYACGGEPRKRGCCDRYFCSKHLKYTGKNSIPKCERCLEKKDPFPYKPETQERIDHVKTDESWAEWRKDNLPLSTTTEVN